MDVALDDSLHHMLTPSISDPLVAALLEVARVRFELFREHFGRDPEPDEPLLFDPDKGEPTAATQADCRVQLLSAALASEVDASAVLGLLGYELPFDA
jgi:hypothetical protein